MNKLKSYIKRNIKLILSLLLVIYLFSCTTLIKYEILDKEGNILPPEKLLLKGQQAYDYKSYDIALKYFNLIIEKYPENTYYCAWAYYEIGFVYYSIKKYDEALKYLNILIEKYPDEKEQVSLANFLISKIKEMQNKNNNKF